MKGVLLLPMGHVKIHNAAQKIGEWREEGNWGGVGIWQSIFLFPRDCSRDDFSNGATVLSANTKYCQGRSRLRRRLLVKFQKERPLLASLVIACQGAAGTMLCSSSLGFPQTTTIGGSFGRDSMYSSVQQPNSFVRTGPECFGFGMGWILQFSYVFVFLHNS